MKKTVYRTRSVDVRVCDVCGRELTEVGRYTHFKKKWFASDWGFHFNEEHDFCQTCYDRLCKAVNIFSNKEYESIVSIVDKVFDEEYEHFLYGTDFKSEFKRGITTNLMQLFASRENNDGKLSYGINQKTS